MCNINILMSKKPFKENLDKTIAFMQSVTSASFVYNSHADGAYFNHSHVVIKSFNKIDFLGEKEHFKESTMVLTHQRLATSGFTEESNQPFISDGFVFAHNGILTEYADKDKSDSLNLFYAIIEHFKANKEEFNREIRIISAIRHCLEDKNGSYSIVLYDIEYKMLYYFKNSSTDINFFRGKNSLFITTKMDNKLFLDILGEKMHKLKIKDNSIYKVYFDNDNFKVLKIGKIKHKTIFVSKNEKSYSWDNWGYSRTYSTNKNEDIEILNSPSACKYCNTNTYRFNKVYNEIICFQCDNELSKTKGYM